MKPLFSRSVSAKPTSPKPKGILRTFLDRFTHGQPQPSGSPENYVIVVLGLAGSGKSTFINLATNRRTTIADKQSLEIATKSVHAISYTPEHHTRTFHFIDTLGLDIDNHQTCQIFNQVVQLSPSQRIDALIYLRRSDDHRSVDPTVAYARVFRSLGGPDWKRKTTFVTTQWGTPTKKAMQMEGRQSILWRASEARVDRFYGEYADAWRIINQMCTPRALVIVLLGASGSGRTTFINTATGRPTPPSDPNKASLEPKTTEVEAISYQSPARGREVVFIDTPELQNMDQTQISEKVRARCSKIRVDGIIYMQDIERNRSPPITTYGSTFKSLAGKDWAMKTIGVTSRWSLDSDQSEELRARHAEIARLWKAIGMKEARFSKVTQDEAWRIVDLLLDDLIIR
ncbi:Translocase of chloroplast [Pleurotus pulmonarius]|nr:Translocase of chloroplast [Pleurotus pulmonarius]KAF4594078.1 Translocase of chloroplast [Pleurotus pulmonarius]